MKILLAGYNVDSEVLEDLNRTSPGRKDITPETLSAAYARISRDPRPAPELRAAARQEVDKARRSNRSIIFKMGHHSVAEHAVFNIDILGASRLAIEEIQKFRLSSYTEKSQRYQVLKDDYVLPVEVKRAGMEKLFEETVKAQYELYDRLYLQLKPYIFDIHKDKLGHPRAEFILDGWAKEDARYAVSLATTGQMGMTINARNLELLIRRFASKDLMELKEFNRKIYDLVRQIAPSIILFTEASDFDARTSTELKKAARNVGMAGETPERNGDTSVRLVDHSPEGDIRLCATLLYSVSERDYSSCLTRAGSLSHEEKENLVRTALQNMEFYDSVLREFEYPDLTFDLILSASCFAQLKRHRMASMIVQNYLPFLGVTIPPTIQAIGAEQAFKEMIARTEDAYDRLRAKIPVGAEYVLTNAHRRRILFKVNARELYHVSRLREDVTAQWDIRELVGTMTSLAAEVMPLTFLLIGGKDAFPRVYERVFGRPPKVRLPE